MSKIKTTGELDVIREGGKKLAEIREALLKSLIPGAVPFEIDLLAKELIAKTGGSPSFMTVGDYKWATCINVNDVVVHGIPNQIPLLAGDVVGLDVGLLYEGFHTDTSWSIQIPNEKADSSDQEKINKFLQIGQIALENAISQAKTGNRIGHISEAIQNEVESSGYSVVESLVGHGVGRSLHEAPQVPGVLTKAIAKTPLLFPGMVLAVEVIYNMGKSKIVVDEDGWTLRSADGSLSGLFEQTIIITNTGPEVVT